MTWAQLGQHKKPVLLANINRFWQPLIDLISHMQDEAYIRKGFEVSFLNTDQVDKIIPLLRDAVRTESDSQEPVGRVARL